MQQVLVCFPFILAVKKALSRFNRSSAAATNASVSIEKFSSDKFGLNIKKDKTRVMTNTLFSTNTRIATKLNTAHCALTLSKTFERTNSKSWLVCELERH